MHDQYSILSDRSMARHGKGISHPYTNEVSLYLVRLVLQTNN